MSKHANGREIFEEHYQTLADRLDPRRYASLLIQMDRVQPRYIKPLLRSANGTALVIEDVLQGRRTYGYGSSSLKEALQGRARDLKEIIEDILRSGHQKTLLAEYIKNLATKDRPAAEALVDQWRAVGNAQTTIERALLKLAPWRPYAERINFTADHSTSSSKSACRIAIEKVGQ